MLLMLVPLGAAVQPGEPKADDPLAARWGSKLARLTPAEPMGYFLLGEDVAGEATDIASRDLARRLFVLAYEMDAAGAKGGERRSTTLAASVCLALASLATREDERRWLVALAETLSDRAAPAALAGSSGVTDATDVAFDLATAMGFARAGEGRRAEQLLDKPGVTELLERADSMPMPDGTIGGLRSFMRRTVRDWPVCPQCRNRRVVAATANRNGELVVCDTCRGNPGPAMTDMELSNQLRIESALLQGTQRSWAAQVLSDAGAPLRDLDPAELAGTYSVDPTRPVWRNGEWAEPDAPASGPPTAPVPGEAPAEKK